MSKRASNLPSITTKDNAFGSERGDAIEGEKDSITLLTTNVKDMLDLTWMKSGIVNKDDGKATMKKTIGFLDEKKFSVHAQRIYTCYQNRLKLLQIIM